MKRKILWGLALTVFICLVCSLSGADSVGRSGSCGPNAQYQLDEYGTLTITGTGEIYGYNDIPWQNSSTFKNAVKTISIGEGITGIGDSAFTGFSNLNQAALPNTMETIGDSAFYNCTKLTAVSPLANYTQSKNSHLTSIESNSFRYTAIYRLAIPNTVKTIGSYAFASCTKLEIAILPEKLESIGEGVFSNCSLLDQLDLPFTLKEIGKSAFSGCSALSEITIPIRVTSIGNGAFNGCTNLASVVIPYKVTEIKANTFKSCSRLQDVYFMGTTSEWNAITVGSNNDPMNNALKHFYCGAFECGDSLYGYLDRANKQLIIRGSGVMYDYAADYETPWEQNKSLFKSAAFEGYATRIGNHAFDGFSRLENIAIPSGVKSIGDYALKNCSELKYAVIPASVNTIGEGVFSGCSGLTDIYYAGTAVQWAGITGVSGIPSGITVHYSSSSGECGNDMTWTLDAEGTLTVRGTGPMVDRSFSSDWPWHQSSGIKKVVVTDGITHIGDCAFALLSNLETVEISDTVTTFGKWCFQGNNKLQSVTLPPNLESLPRACFHLSKLESLVIPEGVTVVNENALGGMPTLTSVTFPSTLTAISDYCFGTSQTDAMSVTVQVPCDSYALTWARERKEASAANFAGYTVYDHKNIISQDAVPETCEENGHDAGEVCTVCGEVISGMTERLKTGHSLTPHEREDSTCTAEGTEAYWECSVCGKLFSDAEAANAITEPETIQKESHNLTKTDEVAATCKTVGCRTYWTCSACGKMFSDEEANNEITEPEVIAEAEHTSVTIPAVVPTETETGLTWGSCCSVCGEIIVEQLEIPAIGSMKVLRLPSSLSIIESEAFSNLACQGVIIPESCTAIGEHAFADCAGLLYIRIPASVKSYPENTFEGCDDRLLIDWQKEQPGY